MNHRFKTLAVLFGFILLSATVQTSHAASRKPVVGKKGMAVAVEPLATQIAADILKKGGNAVDAAVGLGLALAVTHPSAGNIGGGGFMVIRLADGTAVAVDYREKAPGKAHARMYLDPDGNRAVNQNVVLTRGDGTSYHPFTNRIHHLAIGVPGTVAGFALALEKYGTMSMAEVIQPAIDLAENGFILTERIARGLNGRKVIFDQIPASKAAMLRSDGEAWQEGDRWIQKDLAETLKLIAQHGHDGFYKGRTAELIEKDMKAGGGMIDRTDLANYQAIVREPIRNTYRGEYEIISMPPPSSGGITMSLMLNILEGYDVSRMGHNASNTLHVMTEAMRRAYAERARNLGDADFVEIPGHLTTKEYAAELRTTIDPYFATPSEELGPELTMATEPMETTHYSVVDQWGNAVSNTYTLEGGYGSHIVIAGTGMITNNEMGDFNYQPGVTRNTGQIGTPPNLIEPNKRMLSSMSPTIVTRNGELYLVVGSPGGRTIINTTMQLILNVVDHGMNIQEAVDAPRIHHQWFPDFLRVEGGVGTDVVDALKTKGHNLSSRGWGGGSYRQGDGHSIMVDPETGDRLGAPDPRIEGAAFGH
ncbi:MAG: gamma-glutamyltransferase [Gemmatimonadota bacterium]|nr:gamma-glutamyltransferase [Gemmatimonadota bacterium]